METGSVRGIVTEKVVVLLHTHTHTNEVAPLIIGYLGNGDVTLQEQQ